MKKSKEGAWQKRFFETNGNYLTYYKSRKMTKLLAALNLAEVGEINVVNEVDDLLGPGVIFRLELKDKSYLLRARTLNQCQQWITVLKQLKLQASGTTQSPLIDNNETRKPESAPMVVESKADTVAPTSAGFQKNKSSCCSIS